MKTTIGGDRLGSGNKTTVDMKSYSRSTHDLSYLWRSSMSAGTLVPFMNEIALPGDNFEIDLNCEVMTLPTVGPLFGSFKVQLDVFECPIRLYQGKLHMNMLNIGMDMSKIKLPQAKLNAQDEASEIPQEQINPSCIWSYLGMAGLGRAKNIGEDQIERYVNAVPYLAYWDIYKQYYANKQEERGYVIHTNGTRPTFKIPETYLYEFQGTGGVRETMITGTEYVIDAEDFSHILIPWEGEAEGKPDITKMSMAIGTTADPDAKALLDAFNVITFDEINKVIRLEIPKGAYTHYGQYQIDVETDIPTGEGTPELTQFNLDLIDTMKMDILSAVGQANAFMVDDTSIMPYSLSLKEENNFRCLKGNQEGLGIKTYQSDLFNNWISTEWIDGTNGINEITAVSTAGDEFTIDALNLASKVYTMLNRIAISGGSYDDWLDAVYTHERSKSCENPMYHGSLIKELGFQEVISNSATTVDGIKQPLGELAGRGRLTSKHKGGRIHIKVNEPSVLIGIVSLTPRVDYSQGNHWSMNLETLNDLHKPELSQIGYQDLITDQLAWFDTQLTEDGEKTFKSAGKQPAWINYMTNVNRVKGNFAIESKEMFMTLNRRYEKTANGIGDLTTYIDPSKYNYIFADKRIDAQNFWVQISNNITARRKMSAKVIPNL